MANRAYVDVQTIKDSLGITSSTDDILLRRIAEAGTALVERYTNRRFQVERATRYFPGANTLWVDDLLTVSTIKLDEEATSSFDTTLTTSDYVLMPFNYYPKTRIETTEYGDYGAFANGVQRGVEIVGDWGYGDGETASSTRIESKLSTASITATATSLGVVSDNLAAGQTWLIDNEQMYVKFITASTARVDRAVNGTSATSHAASADINIYQYPPDIWQACLNLAIEEYQQREKKGLTSEHLGDYSYSLDKNAINSILEDSIPHELKRMRF